MTDDSGRDARNPSVRDEVHAVGGQLGLTSVPWVAALNVHYVGEFRGPGPVPGAGGRPQCGQEV